MRFSSPIVRNAATKLGLVVAFGLLATAARARPADPLTDLIRDQTDLFADASQRGDQATVDRLTDDQVLFSAGDGKVQRDVRFDSRGGVALALEARTEAVHGGGTAMRRAADPSALFVDETGAANPVSDFRGGAASVSDFVAHHSADVAVVSFTLQARGARFLGVEIWRRRAARWRLIGGQTIPLNEDPPAIALSAEALDAYVGTYSAGPGSIVVISRDGDALASTTGAAPPSPLKPEARDLFFTPGLPSGYLRTRSRFQRDKVGRVTGFARNGVAYARIDPAEAGRAGPAPTPGPLKVRDFVLRHSGDIAVATFFHDRDTPYYGQVLHQTYRSMETWVKRGQAWKLIASQGRQM